MGRVTWQSIPEKFRPLPGRSNVVVSRQPDFSAPGAQVVNSLQAAIDLFPAHETVWLIGGAQLYAQAMPLAQQLVVTEIDADYEGDAFAPSINPAEWTETKRTVHTSAQGLGYSLVTLQRN
jgi:dihydrofolate reductase